MPVLALAEENSCIFFAPQSMNETNEIIVPVYTKKLAQNNDGLCGCEFQFAYNTEQFTLCGTELIMNSGEQLKGQDIKLGIYACVLPFRDEIKNHVLSVKKQGVIFDEIVKYNGGIHIKSEEKKISLTIINKLRRQRWVTVKWHLMPEEWDVSPCRETAIFLDQAHGGSAINYAEIVIPINEAWQ